MSNLNIEKYAIAVEDEGDLFLMFEIIRKESGDIYVNANSPGHSLRNTNKHLHWSKHASGEVHSKSYGTYLFPKKITQFPDRNFKGSEVLMTTSIRRGEARTWGIRCHSENYSDVMVIRDQGIVHEFGYQLNVEIVELGKGSWVSSCVYSQIIQCKIFGNHKTPCIVVSLYEVSQSIH